MFMEPVDEYVDDIASYGVDWVDIDNPHIVGHHNEHNAADISGQDAFVTYQPEHPTVVLVPEANCPLISEQLYWLDSQVEALPYFHSGSMDA